MLYDVSSSYLEGRCCELAQLGYNRDGKKGKLQIVYGLLCARRRLPGRDRGVRGQHRRPDDARGPDRQAQGALRARARGAGRRPRHDHAGAHRRRDRAGRARLDHRAARAGHQGAGRGRGACSCRCSTSATWRRSPSPDLSRRAAHRLPQSRSRRASARASARTCWPRPKRDLAVIAAAVRAHSASRCAARPRSRLKVGAVVNRHKMAKHFELAIGEASFAFHRKTEAIAAEAALDGIYVVRTSLPKTAARRRRNRRRLQEPGPGRARLPLA